MNIAILGLGTIGGGVYELSKSVQGITVTRILDREAWMELMTTDFSEIVNDPAIETVVEAMGGLHPAREFALESLNHGKNYVTANKYLVSEFGLELQAAARANGVAFFFSAACGGGIPFLKNLQETSMIDEIKAVGGIMNGTTNFILDRMQAEGMDYAEALKIAQDLGYAEKDPTSDVDGLDTQRKIVLASAMAFGKMPKAGDIPTAGIRNVLKVDIDRLEKEGKRVRLIAMAANAENGVSASVQPMVFSANASESAIAKNINYTWYEGKMSGHFAFTGQGAGKYPTAANMIRDIQTIMSGRKQMLPENTAVASVVSDTEYAYYVRVPAEKAEAIKSIASKLSIEGEWCFAETVPVATAEMHKIMSCVQGSFFAALA